MAPIVALVTGSAGFVGRNLVTALRRRADCEVLEFDIGDSEATLLAAVGRSDTVFHLAGVNRPPSPADYHAGNAGLTELVCQHASASGKPPRLVLASSIQAALDNAYGRSKAAAEQALARYADQHGASAVVFRLHNIFGKWCKPNYNSVVATFCHNVANGLAIEVSDRARRLDLLYIDDAVSALAGVLDSPAHPGYAQREAAPLYSVSLGELADKIASFRGSRTTACLPDVGDTFTRKLHATYLSYLPIEDRAYALSQRCDARGALAEFVKGQSFGQLFVSRTLPGITRGNHVHDTKVEKFLVVAGSGLVRMRDIRGTAIDTYEVAGEDLRVVEIPPGVTHSITNVGNSDMVTLFWASEPFDVTRPDTWMLEVDSEAP